MGVAVMAAGALGGYFGARMAAAGHDVFFIARGSNLEAIKKNGLKVESVHGDLHLPDPNVTDDPGEGRWKCLYCDGAVRTWRRSCGQH